MNFLVICELARIALRDFLLCESNGKSVRITMGIMMMMMMLSFMSTEIGVRIRFLNEESNKYCLKLEQEIVKKFGDIRSESTLNLRNKLHQVS